MKALQGIGAPRFSAPGVGPQQGSPVFAGQYPAPYSPVQVGAAQTDISSMLDTIMPLIILMMMMGMMMPMMKGITAQAS